ncbi:MAG: helix-turn-helix transcriptional regulator, partial [Candidatus Omnitrophota bacterium]
MVRVRFTGYRQIKFLEEIIRRTGLSSEDVAEICNVCGRTFRDWRRGKYTMTYDALSKLCEISKIYIPENIDILPKFWSIKKASILGGKRHFELYGAPGSIESRRKGGINSSKKFMLNPSWARKKGFIVRKEIKHP